MEKICLSVPEMAKRLGICRMKAYDLVKCSGFPAITIGRRVLVPVTSLEKWLEDQAKHGTESV